MSEDNGLRLVLEIEVPEFYVDATTQEAADEWYEGDVLPIVLEEWMREDVGLTFVSIPGEKEQNRDFEVHARVGRIIGARIAASNSQPRSAIKKVLNEDSAGASVVPERPDVQTPFDAEWLET